MDPITCTVPLDNLHTIPLRLPVAMRTYSRQMKGSLRSSHRILFIFVALHSLGYAVDLGRESPSANLSFEGVVHESCAHALVANCIGMMCNACSGGCSLMKPKDSLALCRVGVATGCWMSHDTR